MKTFAIIAPGLALCVTGQLDLDRQISDQMHIVEDNQFQINQQFKNLQCAISQAEKEALLQRLTNVNLAQDQLHGASST